MRVVFFGTPAFAVPTLEALIASSHQVVGVVTQPDKPRGRGQRVSEPPVKTVARTHGVPVLQPPRLVRDELEPVLREWAPDIGVVAAYGKILPEWLLDLPTHGMINVHASLLPKYRGAAPVHRAVMHGDAETGVTIMRVVKALDAGPMLARAVRPIGPDETSEAVERDLAVMGAELAVATIDAIAAGLATETAQNDAEATYAARLTKEEGRIDFTRPARAVHDQVRGLKPWPAAYTFLDGRRLVIHQTVVNGDVPAGTPPGTCIAATGDAITVACGDGRAIDILSLQPEGRRIMTARDFLAGHGQLVGRRFGR